MNDNVPTYVQSLSHEIDTAEAAATDIAAVVRDLRDGNLHDMADDMADLGRQLRIRALDLRGRLAAHVAKGL